MTKRGARSKGLKPGALKSAIEAHAGAASPLAEAKVTELQRVEARIAAGAVALSPEQADTAVLHLWDVGACPGRWPEWALSRFPALIEAGYFSEMSSSSALLAGETVLTDAGLQAICRQAGRAIDAAAACECACAICASVGVREFDVAPAPSQASDDDDYRAFLEGKIKLAPFEGFDVADDEINPALKPHVRAIVRWALKGGRRAIFAKFGLMKTSAQIELMRLIHAKTLRGKAGLAATLIVLPLGVRQEFTNDAAKYFKGKFKVSLKFIRTAAEIEPGRIHLTNYETVRDGKLDPNLFDAVSLDEAAVLRSFGSKTYQEFLPLFEKVRYRFVATATPSPNRLKELIHYAGFLGVMDTGQALTRFFQRNSEKANDLTLYPHKEEEFWLWVHSWAVFLQKPSDLGPGFSDDGFVLPAIEVCWEEVPSDHSSAGEERDGQKLLFKDAALGLKEAAAEKRDSMSARVRRTLDLACEANDQVVVWCHLNDEQDAIEQGLDAQGSSYVSLRGADDLDLREGLIEEWKGGRHRVFLSKPEMYGAGANLQAAHTMVFAGINYSFHDLIQAVHRIYRFGQRAPCRVYFIHTEAEREIVADLKRKWALHDEMQAKMAEIIRRYGLDHSAMADAIKRSIGVERQEAKGERFTLALNDCVAETRTMEANSVDLIVSSIPFGSQYEYVEAYEDFGHCDSMAEFWAQMDFLTAELLRVLKPGRRCEIHVKDRIMFGAVTGKGAPTVYAFSDETRAHFERHGFDFMGRRVIVTDVVRENNQTYRLGWSENAKDGTKMGCGMAEYVMSFRKPQSDRAKGYADDPVVKPKEDYSRARWQIDAHGFWRSSGNRLIGVEELAALGPDKLAKAFTAWSLTEVYDYAAHVEIGEALEARDALPATFMAIAPGSHHPDVWHDINRMATLNSEQSRRRVEQHLCPLQLDVVERLVEMYSMKGELVFDPFAGLGTVPMVAVKKGRRGRGVELNPSSFKDAVFYCAQAEREALSPTLFDLIEAEEVKAA